MLGRQITARQLTKCKRMTMQYMIRTCSLLDLLGITTIYIDRLLAASMTNNPLTGIASGSPVSIKLQATDYRIKQSV